MDAIVPLRKRQDEADRHFASPSYRLAMINAAAQTFVEAGVPDDQAKEFMAKVAAVYPPATPEELYFERLEDPMISMALGERRKELSYFRTGEPVWTKEDVNLVEECMKDLLDRSKTDKTILDRFTKMIFGDPQINL
ncbi:MAG: hypothetical protein HZB91_03555 [Elusimicrobia bacterium]|nr:hypothetical protein [Elusimicrobiota bacterium]